MKKIDDIIKISTGRTYSIMSVSIFLLMGLFLVIILSYFIYDDIVTCKFNLEQNHNETILYVYILLLFSVVYLIFFSINMVRLCKSPAYVIYKDDKFISYSSKNEEVFMVDCNNKVFYKKVVNSSKYTTISISLIISNDKTVIEKGKIKPNKNNSIMLVFAPSGEEQKFMKELEHRINWINLTKSFLR